MNPYENNLPPRFCAQRVEVFFCFVSCLTKESIQPGKATDEQLKPILRDELKSKCSRTQARAQGSGEVAWSNRDADFSDKSSIEVLPSRTIFL